MKTLKTMLLICVLSVPALGGVIDAPCPPEGCAPPLRSEPTLQEQITIDLVAALTGLVL